MDAPTKPTKWKKILYADQGVPDNYVDASFLDELKRNLWTRSYTYWSVVYESGVVTQQLSSVCLFGITFAYMNEKKLSAQLLFTISSICTLIGYILNDIVDGGESRRLSKRTRVDDLKTAILFTGFSFGLSPLLVSLTETVSTDTIYAMTTVMLLANLLFHDYEASAAMTAHSMAFDEPVVEHWVSGALSLNAATFASVCLASRLNTTWHAFATVTFSFELFALWPVLRRKLKTYYPRSQPLMTAALGLTGVVTLYTVSTAGAVLFAGLNIFITFICPYWLTKLQLYKNNIHGPWDEAVPVKD